MNQEFLKDKRELLSKIEDLVSAFEDKWDEIRVDKIVSFPNGNGERGFDFYFTNFIPDQPKQDVIGILQVETDWDFGIVFNGETYAENEFALNVRSLDELRNISYLGSFGSPLSEDTKNDEVKYAIEQILKNPTEHFSNLGGNRGASWFPIPKESLKL